MEYIYIYTIMHMRIVCILLLLPQRKAGRSWQMVGKDFILCLHIIPVDHMKISPDQKVDCLELEGGKKPSLNERNWIEIHLRSWDLEGFFHVFSIWNLLNSSWQLWKTPNFQVRSFPTTLQGSRCCHGIAISRCNSPYFKGPYGIRWFHQPLQTTSNHFNIQFQPLKTSLTNRLAQSNLLKYTGDWWLFWNQFWDTASIIPFISIQSHLKGFHLCILF